MKDLIQLGFNTFSKLTAISEGLALVMQDRIDQIQSQINYAIQIPDTEISLSDGTMIDKATWITEQQTEITRWQAILDRLL